MADAEASRRVAWNDENVQKFLCRCSVRTGARMGAEQDEERPITIRSLSIPQLIQILQLDDCDDELTLMVEEELTRRKTGGACQ